VCRLGELRHRRRRYLGRREVGGVEAEAFSYDF
jgi:hypothetical protein